MSQEIEYQLTEIQYTELLRSAMKTQTADTALREAKSDQDRIMSLVLDAHGADLKCQYKLLADERKIVLVTE